MVKALKRLEKKISHPVTETSYFYEFFLYKFNSILGLDEKHLFTNTFGFKKKYMKVMAHESAVVHKALDKFRSHFIATLTGNKKLFA
jgi:hypothetical protein